MDPDTNTIRYQCRPSNTDAVFTRFLVQAIFAVLLYISKIGQYGMFFCFCLTPERTPVTPVFFVAGP